MPDVLRPSRRLVLITRERQIPQWCKRGTLRPERTRRGDIAPDGAYTIENILKLRLGESAVYSEFTASVLDLVEDIRNSQPGRSPSTAEVIELVQYCELHGVDWSRPISEQPVHHNHAVIVLTKTESDNGIAKGVLDRNSSSGSS